jgi:tetratricopeptide (TPR) repeat protein
MRILWSLLILLAGVKEDSLINKAILLYENRHQNPNSLIFSKELLEKVVAQGSKDPVAYYTLGKVYFTLAEQESSKKIKLSYFKAGAEYSQQALQYEPNTLWGHFWYMANIGKIAQLRGPFSSLKLAQKVKNALELMWRIDSNNVWVLNAYANYYLELPEVLGGNVDKALELLKKAFEIDSGYSNLYISLARIYIKKRDYAKAESVLTKFMSLNSLYPAADYLLEDRPRAIKLLTEIRKRQ